MRRGSAGAACAATSAVTACPITLATAGGTSLLAITAQDAYGNPAASPPLVIKVVSYSPVSRVTPSFAAAPVGIYGFIITVSANYSVNVYIAAGACAREPHRLPLTRVHPSILSPSLSLLPLAQLEA